MSLHKPQTSLDWPACRSAFTEHKHKHKPHINFVYFSTICAKTAEILFLPFQEYWDYHRNISNTVC